MTKHITLPLTEDTIQDLKAGDSVLLSGTVITGRDAAHKRLFELIEKGSAAKPSIMSDRRRQSPAMWSDRRVPLPAIAWTSSHRRCSTSG